MKSAKVLFLLLTILAFTNVAPAQSIRLSPDVASDAFTIASSHDPVVEALWQKQQLAQAFTAPARTRAVATNLLPQANAIMEVTQTLGQNPRTNNISAMFYEMGPSSDGSLISFRITMANGVQLPLLSYNIIHKGTYNAEVWNGPLSAQWPLGDTIFEAILRDGFDGPVTYVSNVSWGGTDFSQYSTGTGHARGPIDKMIVQDNGDVTIIGKFGIDTIATIRQLPMPLNMLNGGFTLALSGIVPDDPLPLTICTGGKCSTRTYVRNR